MQMVQDTTRHILCPDVTACLHCGSHVPFYKVSTWHCHSVCQHGIATACVHLMFQYLGTLIFSPREDYGSLFSYDFIGINIL